MLQGSWSNVDGGNNMYIEEDYKIAPTEDGRFVVVINAYDEPVEKPRIVYAGGEHAVLFRNSNPDDAVVLTCINKLAQPLMRTASTAFIAEQKQAEIKRDYLVQIEHVKELPVEITPTA